MVSKIIMYLIISEAVQQYLKKKMHKIDVRISIPVCRVLVYEGKDNAQTKGECINCP